MPKMNLMNTDLPRSFTDHIGRKAAENICHAFDYAKHIGQPLNHYVTINLREAAHERSAAQIFTKIRHKFRDWLNNAGKRSGINVPAPAYVYSIEAPAADHPHANWVLHVPNFLVQEFQKKLPIWVSRAMNEIGPFDIHIQNVNPASDKALAKYIIKGTDARYVDYLFLQKVAAPQGRVWGRRATASPYIGRTARRRAGFVPRRDRGKWAMSVAAE